MHCHAASLVIYGNCQYAKALWHTGMANIAIFSHERSSVYWDDPASISIIENL